MGGSFCYHLHEWTNLIILGLEWRICTFSMFLFNNFWLLNNIGQFSPQDSKIVLHFYLAEYSLFLHPWRGDNTNSHAVPRSKKTAQQIEQAVIFKDKMDDANTEAVELLCLNIRRLVRPEMVLLKMFLLILRPCNWMWRYSPTIQGLDLHLAWLVSKPTKLWLQVLQS